MLYVRPVVDWFFLALVNFEGYGLQRQVARNLVGHERQCMVFGGASSSPFALTRSFATNRPLKPVLKVCG